MKNEELCYHYTINDNDILHGFSFLTETGWICMSRHHDNTYMYIVALCYSTSGYCSGLIINHCDDLRWG